MSTTYIYLITNIDHNPYKSYIGKTKNINSRKNSHKRKYGYDIEFTIIDEVQSSNYKDWEPLETYWIEQFKQWNFNVVNTRQKGGSGPIYRTEIDKNRIGIGNKGKKKPGVSLLLKGRKSCHKDDTGHKISEAKKGFKQTEEWKKNRSKSMMGKLKPTVQCPYCNKIGAVHNMPRWHFENCKYK